MGEEWVIVVRLPRDVPNGGRYMARVLKYLLRTWGVRCVALRERPPAALQCADPHVDAVGAGVRGDAAAARGVLVSPDYCRDVKPVGFPC